MKLQIAGSAQLWYRDCAYGNGVEAQMSVVEHELAAARSIHDLPLLLTVDEIAVILRISRGRAYEACRQGAIPSVRIGRRLLVPRARLAELLGESD